MAAKPTNPPYDANFTASQGTGQPRLSVSFESDPAALADGDSVDVRGVSYVMVYGTGVTVNAHDAPGDTAVPLLDITGAAVTVTGARLVDVRGVRWINVTGATSVVVFTG